MEKMAKHTIFDDVTATKHNRKKTNNEIDKQMKI